TTWRIGDTGLERITHGALRFFLAGVTLKVPYVDVLAFDLTDIEFVDIEGGGAVDSFFAPPTPTTGQRYEILPNAAENIRITGGTADDTYVFGSDENGLNVPNGSRGNFSISIKDQGGNDSLIVNDRATQGMFEPGSISADYLYTETNQLVQRDVFDHTTNMNGDPVTLHDQFQVKYAGLENVDLNGGSVDASYALDGFKGTALSVYTGTADDRVA